MNDKFMLVSNEHKQNEARQPPEYNKERYVLLENFSINLFVSVKNS